MKAKVAQRGQVTIPKFIREQLGIRPGTVLDFHLDKGKLVASKVITSNPVDQFFGVLITMPGGSVFYDMMATTIWATWSIQITPKYNQNWDQIHGFLLLNESMNY